MKKIETPLTWTLTGLMIILLISFGLSNSSVNFNISEASSKTNKGYNLVTDHNIQTVSSFNIKDPNMGIAAMAEGLYYGDSIALEGDTFLLQYDLQVGAGLTLDSTLSNVPDLIEE
mgnify:FL=1